MDDLKFRAILKHLQVKFRDQTYQQIKDALESFQEVQKQKDYHLIYKHIGFEMFFKYAVQKYGSKMEVSK